VALLSKDGVFLPVLRIELNFVFDINFWRRACPDAKNKREGVTQYPLDRKVKRKMPTFSKLGKR